MSRIVCFNKSKEILEIRLDMLFAVARRNLITICNLLYLIKDDLSAEGAA